MKQRAIVGSIFQRWTVVGQVYRSGHSLKVPARCICGTERDVDVYSLQAGTSHSCGCFKVERSRELLTVHGGTDEPLFRLWMNIRNRCLCKSNPKYPVYGGRGIRLCERWLDYRNFKSDVGVRPGRDYSLDRVDNNGDYGPNNFRWATAEQQANNKQRTVKVSINGKTLSTSQWAKIYGIGGSSILERIRAGWDPVAAVTTPAKYKFSKSTTKETN